MARPGLAGTLFLLSGATALCYQVAWTRHLVLVFGNTTYAVALILAAYMLGLALGSEYGGRVADRHARPGYLYALIELGIGIFAVFFAPLLGLVQSGYLALGASAGPVLFIGAFLVLLVPTFLMGATLPLLVRATVRDAEATGPVVGTLYGLNLFGAVLGTAFTGFYLIEAAGVLGATYWAAGVNVLIFLVGVIALRGAVPRRSPDDERLDAAPRGAGEEYLIETERRAAAARAALVAVFAGGMVGLGAEVVWTRLLVFFLQGFTYTFTAMLAVFLLGLGLGGVVFGRWAGRTREPAVLLGHLQVVIGVAAAAVLVALGMHLDLTTALWEFVGWGMERGVEKFGGGGEPGVRYQPDIRVRHVFTLVLASGAALLLPAFLMGGVFPLASAAYQRGLHDLGSRIGRLYAANTLGAVIGSLVAGFVLAPTLGMAWAAVVIAGLSLAAGAAVLGVAGLRGPRLLASPLAGLALVVVLVWFAEPSKPFLLRSHAFQGPAARENRLLRTLEGTVCQVSVVENEREGYKLLYTDEFQAAGTKPEYRYMRMLAHLPVALVEDPARVLCICWGTGTTAGSVSTHDAVKKLDIVEISPEVLEVAGEFESFNRGALEGAGREDGFEVDVHIDDGRHFVLRSQERWDVITLEPLMPYTPAAIHFYTRDFYAECRPRLTENGVMCQWIPLQGMSREHFRQLVAAFVGVYPGSAMFFVDGAVALIGGPKPVEIRYDRVAERLRGSRVQADLGEVGYADPVRAIATYVASGEALRRFVQDVEPVTDEFPVLEFHPIPLRAGVLHLWQNLTAIEELRQATTRIPVQLDEAANPGVDLEFVRALRVGQELSSGQRMHEEASLLVRAGEPERARETLMEARKAYARASQIDPQHATAKRLHGGLEREWQIIKARSALDAGDLDAAEDHALRCLEYPSLRQADAGWTLLAEIRNRAEEFEGALSAAVRATRLFRRGRDALAERAYARGALGDFAGAADDYRRAVAGDPIETLPPRLASDAGRLLADPALGGGPDAHPSADIVPLTDAELREQIEVQMRGEASGRIPTRLMLGILAADHGERFDDVFAADMATLGDPQRAATDRLAALARVRSAVPTGSAELLRSVLLETGTTQELRREVAVALAEVAPAVFAQSLPPEPSASLAAIWAEAARELPARRVADRLLELLVHPRVQVRRPAWLSAFGALGADAPGLQRLDVDRFDDPDYRYRDRVQDVRAWWVRNRSEARFSR